MIIFLSSINMLHCVHTFLSNEIPFYFWNKLSGVMTFSLIFYFIVIFYSITSIIQNIYEIFINVIGPYIFLGTIFSRL